MHALPPGVYLTNNMLEGYDTYEELGPCTNRCFFCCDTFKELPGTPPASFVKRNPGDNAKILLCGGEPTGLAELFDTLHALKRRYRTVCVVTNGVRLQDAAFAERLAAAGVDELIFSLHGHDAATHDRVTGVAGSYVGARKGLEQAQRLVASGAAHWELAVNSVFTKTLLPHLEPYLQSVTSLGISLVCFSTLLPLGRGEQSFGEEMLPYREMVAALRRAGARLGASPASRALRVVLVHVPFCVVPPSADSGFTYLLTRNAGEFGSLIGPALRERCQGCPLVEYCEGVFDFYADAFGLDEFHMEALQRAGPVGQG